MAIAAHAPFDAAVRARGLDFRPLPVDIRDELGSADGRRVLRTSPLAVARFLRLYARHRERMGEGVEAAAAGADLVLTSPMGWLGVHVAEAMGVPSAGVYLQPMSPTREFPPWLVTGRSLGPWGNVQAARAARTLGMVPFGRAVNGLRRRLGLRPVSARQFFRRLEAARWPIFYGISPTVLPSPADWPPHHRTVGYWWPEPEPGREPDPRLVEFLDAGPPPVFVGFGSMSGRDGAQLGELVVDALRRAGLRGVLQRGWGGLAGAGDDVLSIGPTPHDWLFPRMAAVVHHAGAGTTAAGLRAGVPAVPTPLAADQPFWAARLVALGVALAALPHHRLDAGELAAALRAATDGNGFRARAGELARRIAAEDGASAVADGLGLG